ncbi:FAD-binding domain-containing protein [Peniophora sp. CONT]|nr:FAD-binding domain-containing protein [Peniophora sp. CONT]
MFAPAVIATLLLTARSAASVASRSPADVCAQIAGAISSASGVYYPLSIEYTNDNKHWMGSSSQTAACSVEPGTAEDVGKILQIVGSTNTSFAVKGGGHASNVGFSSTTGVMIAMTRFNNVTLSEDKSSVDVGAGLVWDDVYGALDGTGVNIVGGRVSGVGVAGFALGGGYSWKTSQYGLTSDNIAAFELVLPNGTMTTVTAADDDLYFALRGGFNNFGIVTNFKLNTHPQPDTIWGGTVVFTADQLHAVSLAIANFSQNNTDKKAMMLPTYNSAIGIPGATVIVFYDGPSPPAGIFDTLLTIPALSSGVQTHTFNEFVASFPADLAAPTRGAFMSSKILSFTPSIMDLIGNLTVEYGSKLTLLDSAYFLSFDVEPFADSLLTHGSASAWPPDRSRGLLPLNLYFAWALPSADEAIWQAMKDIANNVTAQAVAEGQDVADATVYGNYALADTPLEAIYGDNVERLRAIHAAVDPGNVMGLAGGFKF